MTDPSNVDVAILGGGLAGLCLARQLRRELPEASVLLVDKSARPLPEAAHKVGESSVELASRYFEHGLELGEYLRERHLIKNGLRFFPGGGATHALADRVEIGPPQLPVVPSFQLDRGRLENDLRAMCEADGVVMREGVGVQRVLLGEAGAGHTVMLADGETIGARWVVDATGRRRLLARQLGLSAPSGHLAHAAWFRIEGRLDVDHLVPKADTEWHGRDPDGIRWLSTSHLMGEGYWVWIIPLSSGRTSIGAVVHGRGAEGDDGKRGVGHDFDAIRTLPALRDWLAAHEPALAEALTPYEVADFRCLRDYSYSATRCFSVDRWALIGEAGLFVDPFYSPGSDFIALANGFTTQLIEQDLAGEDDGARAELTEFTDWFYRRLAAISTATYADAAEAYGKPRVMAAKIYWDNFNYWSFVCPYYFQDLWRGALEEQREVVPVAERWASLNLRGQALFREWAARTTSDTPERRHVVFPPIPSVLASLHLDLEKPMSPGETRASMADKADQAEELLGELLLRAIHELGPDAGTELVEALGAHDWPLPGLAARLEAELGGRGRRKRITRLVRDLERTIGRAVPAAGHDDLAGSARAALPTRLGSAGPPAASLG